MANQYKDLAAIAAALQTYTQGRLYVGTRHVSKQQLARSYDRAGRPGKFPMATSDPLEDETGADGEALFSLPFQRILELQVL
eukprot:SAG22_NODE_1173_length_5253_cov_4.401436_2_plen_82_part_00